MIIIRWLIVPLLALSFYSLLGCNGDSSNADSGSAVDLGDLTVAIDHAAPDLAREQGTTDQAAADLAPDLGLGAPITAPAKTWTWIPFPDARCADNSVTGIGVNLNLATSKKVLIYLQGGGACWDVATCITKPIAANLDGFDEAAFKALNTNGTGILNRNSLINPFKEWNYVVVPYCTGDLHSGRQYSAISKQHHLGHANISAYLKRLIPTFTGATQVLLTGSSAGGLGSLFNYHQVKQAFAPLTSNVDLLDDSGPMLESTWLKPKLQQYWRAAWGLAQALPPGCAKCQTGNLEELPRYLAATHPTRRFGLISSQHDQVVRGYYGQGYTPVQVMPAADLEAGLDSLADSFMAPYPNFRVYYTAASWHVYLNTASLALTSVSKVKLVDWIDDLASGQTGWKNVRP
jgi:hypothetical protein